MRNLHLAHRQVGAENYHWPNDVADNLHWSTIKSAIAVCDRFLRMRARPPATSG